MNKEVFREIKIAQIARALEIEFTEHSLRVISGFPGVGKSYIATALGDRVVDMDYPGLPMDLYIEKIADAVNGDCLVLVPSWDTLRQAMADANIRYAVAYPVSVYAREQYVERYKARGSTDRFIQTMMTQWDDFLLDMSHDPAQLHIELPHNTTLGDIIEQSGILEHYYHGV